MTNEIILERIRALYEDGTISGLAAYVAAGLITQSEADAIAGGAE